MEGQEVRILSVSDQVTFTWPSDQTETEHAAGLHFAFVTSLTTEVNHVLYDIYVDVDV